MHRLSWVISRKAGEWGWSGSNRIPPALILIASLGSLSPLWAQPSELSALIQEAGNVEADEDRLAILREIRALPGLSEDQKGEADSLIAEVEHWVRGPRLEFFGSRMVKENEWDFGVPEDSPLYPLVEIYLARMKLWTTLEYGGIWTTPEAVRKRYDEVRAAFEKAVGNFPENDVLRMCLGEVQQPAQELSRPGDAPSWAVDQREALERLSSIIGWWIDHRMQEDGQYGGGWGDDCEMWRWWVPILIGFEDPKIDAAQAKFSKALMNREDMREGYTSHVFDVEHTAEDSSDVITPMMHLEPDNPVWSEKARRLMELFENLWTGSNERGFLQFKSTYFSSQKVDPDPRKACDSVYHVRAIQPSLLYWQRTGDPWVGGLVTRWMDTWVDAAFREERGKPAGIIPSALHWPEGTIGGLGKNWWDPENHSSDPLYVWPSAMSQMTQTLLLAWRMTGEDKYLVPIRSMARIRLDFLNNPRQADPETGSLAWCAGKMTGISEAVGKYRFLSGSTEFDPLLATEAGAYLAFRLTGDRKGLADALAETGNAFRINTAGYTSEVRFTDRVLRFPTVFQPGRLTEEGVPGIPVPDTQLLYSTVTGDPGSALYFPMNAVRWLTPARDIAALVTDSGPERFRAELYQFGEAEREMGAELFLFGGSKEDPVQVSWSLRSEQKSLVSGALMAEGKPIRMEFDLPPATLCQLEARAEQVTSDGRKE